MAQHLGKQSIRLDRPVTILSGASTVGPKEGEGPLAGGFDVVLTDALAGEKTWEAAESKIVETTLKMAVEKAFLTIDDIDYIFAGDLLNQSIGSTFGIRSLNRPFFGIFGACSTFGEAIALGSILIDGGGAGKILAGASSHFCSAEKQFRFPLEMGGQRTPTASWTVTGDGAVVLSDSGEGPKVTHITTGRIVDLGITDANNMGAAMAPAAKEVIKAHFEDTGRTPDYYDVIATGDLGRYGKQLCVRLLSDDGITMTESFTDCGIEIFDNENQDTHAGGSGCACSAVTFCAYFYKQLRNKEINRLLLIPTGALMSPTSTQQGESIPGVAHAVAIENI